jgi:hypothetical protein
LKTVEERRGCSIASLIKVEKNSTLALGSRTRTLPRSPNCRRCSNRWPSPDSLWPCTG